MSHYRICAGPGCTTDISKRAGNLCSVCHNAAQRQATSPKPQTPIPDWTGAACTTVDPELFFPAEYERTGGTIQRERETAAVNVCRRCPIRQACYDYAWTERMTGVWGGTTDTERTERRRAEKRAARREAHRRAL